MVQNALIAKFGRTVLPRYGADGDWGNETEESVGIIWLKAEELKKEKFIEIVDLKDIIGSAIEIHG